MRAIPNPTSPPFSPFELAASPSDLRSAEPANPDSPDGHARNRRWSIPDRSPESGKPSTTPGATALVLLGAPKARHPPPAKDPDPKCENRSSCSSPFIRASQFPQRPLQRLRHRPQRNPQNLGNLAIPQP